MPAIKRSYLEPSCQSFAVDAVPAMIDLGVHQRCPLERLLGRRLYLVDPRYALGRRGIAVMRNDESSRFPIRGQEGIHRTLEVRVLEHLRRQVEGVVVLGGVESLPHGGGVLARFVHLGERAGHGAMHG